jgi:primosomal protein N' (replication factor Y)
LQELLKEKFSINSLVIENTDINSLSKIEKIKNKLESANFVISTSILSSVSDSFIPDLIVFFNADTGLLLPDYNVAEKHFLMLWEFIHNYSCENFLLQTFNAEHYVYKNLLELDLDKFWKEELKYRKQFNYPPYSELAVIMYKSEIEEKLYRKIAKLESELKYLIENQ